ncbi:hypothetical protein [Desulfospira joergensenii]|uniref:hypothetical protein n=1 Tax=Desulfospira joergensenii TaxID=53329 RepID=UPI0003B5745C|nr:hypothetical protein [Desulfospira joergensenii]
MILHDITYEWSGKTMTGEKPISWWPGAYRVRIIRLGSDTGNISYLTPVAAVCKPIRKAGTMNTSLTNCIENFAKAISKEYGLEIEKTLWIELDEKITAAQFHADRKLTDETFYTVSWRPVRPAEMTMIEDYIKDL